MGNVVRIPRPKAQGPRPKARRCVSRILVGGRALDAAAVDRGDPVVVGHAAQGVAIVIGGPGAFILSVQDPSRFAEAIRRKLVLEIAGTSAAARLQPAALPVQTPRVDCLIGEKTRPAWLDEPNR